MKKSSTSSIKTTASKKRPETEIVAIIEVTKIVDDQMVYSDEAKQIIGDIIDGMDADHIEIKNVKYFERRVED